MFKFYVKYHAKFLAALAPFVGLLSDALRDGNVTGTEAKSIGAAIAGALLVYLFPNAKAGDKPPSRDDLLARIDALERAARGQG